MSIMKVMIYGMANTKLVILIKAKLKPNKQWAIPLGEKDYPECKSSILAIIIIFNNLEIC